MKQNRSNPEEKHVQNNWYYDCDHWSVFRFFVTHIIGPHAEPDLPVLRKLIQDNPLGLLTTAIPSPNHPFLQSSHIPFVLDIGYGEDETNLGKLRGHLARVNPQSKVMIENLTENPHLNNVIEQDVIVIFNSPIQHYVTPKLYTETKPTTGKVVPTWNYAAIQVYGRARIFHDTKTDGAGRFLSKQILDLSRHAKNKVMGFTGGDNPIDWKVSDAPDKFIELLKKSIIGIEIEITSMGGKFKMSQEMGMGDRQGVINGMSKMVQVRSDLKEAKKASA
ncbi:putative FMN-binding domain-containing protein [Fusarium venenatum]|uniref:putative FMN-binding domain-containing protein n=1 Tax=Fusarium venenatum TaxID=56646 RepID=UPI001E0BF74F|nr:putative FMN-binding domain-containing protein [Fusarium venenatum]